MKKFIFIVALLVIGTMTTQAQNLFTIETDSMFTVQNKRTTETISYPIRWVINLDTETIQIVSGSKVSIASIQYQKVLAESKVLFILKLNSTSYGWMINGKERVVQMVDLRDNKAYFRVIKVTNNNILNL